MRRILVLNQTDLDVQHMGPVLEHIVGSNKTDIQFAQLNVEMSALAKSQVKRQSYVQVKPVKMKFEPFSNPYYPACLKDLSSFDDLDKLLAECKITMLILPVLDADHLKSDSLTRLIDHVKRTSHLHVMIYCL